MSKTNKEYAESENFLLHCGAADVKPTPRQASKFRRGKGAAYRISVLSDSSCHVPADQKYDRGV